MEEPEEDRERRDVGMKVGEAESLPYLSKPPITTVSPVLCNIIPLSLHNQLVTRACTAAVMIHSLLAWTATCY